MSFCTLQGVVSGSAFQFCSCASLEVQAWISFQWWMPIVSNCMGLFNENRLNIQQMLLVVLNQMDQKCSYPSAISTKGGVSG